MQNLDAPYLKSEHEFGVFLSKVLHASHPLQSREFLRGRDSQLSGIQKALLQPGRHILIHGLRGVGKSSLAQTAAFQYSDGSDPILVGCDPKSTFASVIREIFEIASGSHPALEKSIHEISGVFSKFGITVGAKETVQLGRVVQTASVNDAVLVLDFIAKKLGSRPIIVIDEFDLFTDETEQAQFAALVKQLADRHVSISLIFCGIGENVERMMKAHASADRYFHTVELGQLSYDARFEIVRIAADRLQIRVDNDTVIRIARISDGFPYYVHFLAEKLFWNIYEARNGGVSDVILFERALSDAASGMDMKLRGPYQKATEKYGNEYEFVLWAVADGHELRKQSKAIYESYKRLTSSMAKDPLTREAFNQRMNSLKKDSHGEILSGSRQGWYEFSEKMLRGYVRLRAELAGVMLEADHPAAPRRFNGAGQ